MPDPVTRLRVATPNCVADDFGGEIVALNLDTGFYFSLRDLAGGIWRDLSAGHSVGSIVEVLRNTDPSLVEPATKLIDGIVEQGLMVPSADPAMASEPLTVGALAASGVTGILLESYDDMRDLVLTDPVHDVDEEIGWPVRRSEV
jgi:hypothetical protein